MTKLSDVVVRDTFANRPTAGIAGRLFYDTTNSKMQRDNGSSWDDVAEGGGASTVGAEQTYVEKTTDVSVTATVEASADTIVTGAAFTADGTSAYLIEFFCGAARPDNTAANRTLTVFLFEDGSTIGRLGVLNGAAAVSDTKPVYVARRLIPTAGSRTYSIRATVSAGTGLFSFASGGAGANPPGFIRITKAT